MIPKEKRERLYLKQRGRDYPGWGREVNTIWRLETIIRYCNIKKGGG